MNITQARELFPAFRSTVYLDTASRGLLSRPVREAMEWYLSDWEMRGGSKDRWMEELALTRARFARLIGASAEEISFTKNVSEGLNIIGNAMAWCEGDNVVICADVEHPNNIYVWLNLKRRGVGVKMVPSRLGRVTAEDYLTAIDERTRLVSVSHVSFSPGRTLELEALAEACRERGVFLLVDAAQSAGVMHIDVGRCAIDGLTVSTHKGLLGPYGMGYLYCRQDWLERLHPAYLARYAVLVDESEHEEVMGDTAFRLPPDGRRFEIGNYNYLAAIASGAALDLLLSVGTEAIQRHVLDLAGHLSAGLEAHGLHVSSGRPGDGLAPIITAGEWGRGGHYSTRDDTIASLYQDLTEAQVTLALRRGQLRFSLHLYNNQSDIDHVLVLIGRSLRQAGGRGFALSASREMRYRSPNGRL